MESPAGEGLLSWVQLENNDGQPVSGGLHGDRGGTAAVVRGEGGGGGDLMWASWPGWRAIERRPPMRDCINPSNKSEILCITSTRT